MKLNKLDSIEANLNEAMARLSSVEQDVTETKTNCLVLKQEVVDLGGEIED